MDLLEALMSGVGAVGHALDTPGAYLRGALAGDFGERRSGEELAQAWGMLGDNNPDEWELRDFAGPLLEEVLDPSNLIPAGLVAGGLGSLAALMARGGKRADAIGRAKAVNRVGSVGGGADETAEAAEAAAKQEGVWVGRHGGAMTPQVESAMDQVFANKPTVRYPWIVDNWRDDADFVQNYKDYYDAAPDYVKEYDAARSQLYKQMERHTPEGMDFPEDEAVGPLQSWAQEAITDAFDAARGASAEDIELVKQAIAAAGNKPKRAAKALIQAGKPHLSLLVPQFVRGNFDLPKSLFD